MMPPVKGFIAAIKLLTVFPIDTRNRIPAGSMGWTLCCFPAIGLLLGGICAAVLRVGMGLFPAAVASALSVFALALCTGGLHLDGLADTADGLFGGRTREQRLEIMRDTHIGSFGVIALVAFLGLKVLALEGIALISCDRAIGTVLLMPVTGRWIILMAAGMCGYAREEEGTGRRFVEAARLTHFAVCAPFVALCAWWFLGVGGLLMLGVLLVAAPLLILYIRARIGGMTGDTLGAMCETTEVLFLISFFVSRQADLF